MCTKLLIGICKKIKQSVAGTGYYVLVYEDSETDRAEYLNNPIVENNERRYSKVVIKTKSRIRPLQSTLVNKSINEINRLRNNVQPIVQYDYEKRYLPTDGQKEVS